MKSCAEIRWSLYTKSENALANRGSERKVQLLLGNKSLELDLPADALYTLQWS